MALTDQQMADVRRYAGYQLVGTSQPINASQDLVYFMFGMVEMSLYQRLTTLTSVEETTLTTIYLANLYTLESAIPAASGNLDTDQAAVWTHNKREVEDRLRLFNVWRRQMCGFLGCPPGPGLGLGGVTIGRA